MNLANKITISRICLIPIFVVFASLEIPYGNLIAVYHESYSYEGGAHGMPCLLYTSRCV